MLNLTLILFMNNKNQNNLSKNKNTGIQKKMNNMIKKFLYNHFLYLKQKFE